MAASSGTTSEQAFYTVATSGQLADLVPTLSCLVGVTGFNLNPALRSYLSERSQAIERGETPMPVQPPALPRRRRLRDRLTQQDLSALIESFQAGTPAHVLAERYSVGETALKELLRQRGVRRRRQKPQQDEQQTG